MTPELAAQKQHVYILLFTSNTTRAVHLEVTRNKSTTAFMNAFRWFWERMVRTVKLTLYKTFNLKQMEYDMFCTVVTEVSDIVNNRSLAYVTEDKYSLTLNQLIKGGFVNQSDVVPLDEASDIMRHQISPFCVSRSQLS